MSASNLSDLSMLELFRLEADTQLQTLTTGLLALERDPRAADRLESCMRAAHSLKGAGRIVGIGASVDLAHAMEECFVAAQRGVMVLARPQIDTLLKCVDLLRSIANTPPDAMALWDAEQADQVNGIVIELARNLEGTADLPAIAQEALLAEEPARSIPVPQPVAPAGDRLDQHLRVTAEDLNRLLGLASESLVESRWVQPFSRSLLRAKRMQHDLLKALDQLREASPEATLPPPALAALNAARQVSLECQQLLSQRLTELDRFDRNMSNLSHRLYDAALACRMRPFADGVHAFPRMVRDLGRSLGKPARLDIIGETTAIDRDILEKLEAPLTHLLRNAVDHGFEAADERSAHGKPAEGVVRLEAHHAAGRLRIVVADDGRGIESEALRRAIVARNLTNAETASRLSESELLEFLFLPGFTMKQDVTEISGRGVGLDVVQDMARKVGGSVTVTSTPGKGTRFELQLPLTLSVVRVLLVEISGEPYAIPLAHVARTLKIPKADVESVEGRRYFRLDGECIGLVSAHQLFGGTESPNDGDELSVLMVGHREHRYGLVVDRLLLERQLVVQPLDPRFGKVQDIAAGALMEDGSPLLIIDVEDLVRSIEKLVAAGTLTGVGAAQSRDVMTRRKRVLVIDDSLTVRELERKLLDNHGYEVEVAVDGMDGWNAVRSGGFDLVITDVDMPRMNGIELVTLIKSEPQFQATPVMIVSYKDRPEDRTRGLSAGADYYLTKGSFHDDTLLQAVTDLIGGAAA